ncbi:MAG TPA: tRNA (N6-threonylcarbamoyladenosine(37)-N6)-methyltransferase TrmO [Planctomycetaceae bacterium]|nr:tRNA (N6-threonylcarbamoyladenosine(37)-N6)-methyltransferase TrmO [Planctomycetaceae bacterium]
MCLVATVPLTVQAQQPKPATPPAKTPPPQSEKSFTVHPIGSVQNVEGRTMIVLDKKYEKGLLGLEHWSHVQVIWWFDRNDTPQKRAILQVHPRGNPNNPLTGVFACRAPVRPNLIALSLCKVVSVKDNVVEIDKIDAIEGTPVLDLKPYTPGNDRAMKVKVPDWTKTKGSQNERREP